MKLPIEILKTLNNGQSQYRVVISLHDAISKVSLSDEIEIIESGYELFLQNCRKKIDYIQKNRKNRGDSILKWSLADYIYTFAKDLEDKGYILANLTEALTRDLNISSRQTNYLIDFRENYPKIDLINKDIGWEKYKELLEIRNLRLRKEFERKILSGELKTRNDIRSFKKKHRK